MILIQPSRAFTTPCFTLQKPYRLGLTFSSHHAVIAAYGLHFAKTNRLEPHHHRALMDAFEKRQLADYVVDSGFAQDDVDDLLENATAFLIAARQWLENNTPTS